MSSDAIWMVRAGKGAERIDEFLDEGFVALNCGYSEIGPIDPATEKAEIARRVAVARPLISRGTVGVWAAQIKRFLCEIKIGDSVTTYDPTRRLYFLGVIASEPYTCESDGWVGRRVTWQKQVLREQVSTEARNTLGAISTLFLVKDEAAAELYKKSTPIGAAPTPTPVPDIAQESTSAEEELVVLEEVATKAREFLEDRIAKLAWEQMQELVAEILRAMGYRARVAPKGADRGVDIIASPDGLGLQEPRIFVEVKHRPGTQISADQVRSFIGGRQTGDRCLYVSTGGFSKDARYEAERSSIPLTLITLPELRELLTEYYDKFTPSGAALIPLERIYWPIS